MSEVTQPARPSCLLCLLQTTASMPRVCTYNGQQVPKLHLARFWIDRTLSGLLKQASRNDPRVKGMEVAVLGYRQDAEGKVSFQSLLPGAAGERFLPLEELPKRDFGQRPDRSYRWIDPTLTTSLAEEGVGPAPYPAAVAQGLHLLQQWLTWHPGAFPPVLLHISDGEGFDQTPEAYRTALGWLSTHEGRIHLAHFVFSDEVNESIYGQCPQSAEGPWQRLWEQASPLAGSDGQPWRAFSLNARPWDVVKSLFLESSTEGAAFPVAVPPESATPTCTIRALWHVKKGNAESEWEDAFAFDEAAGLAAVADGASEGIFARRWSARLVEALVRERPDLTQPEAYTRWFEAARATWVKDIDYPSLRWSQQNKVDQSGASATLLAWRLEPAPPGAADPFAFTAWAIGDSCLFLVRDNQLVGSFPVASSRHFVLGPALLRTKPGSPLPTPVVARGGCRQGDLFLLATDAVAQNLLLQQEQGPPPDWSALVSVEESDWRAQMDSFRETQRIVNDDCTLLAVTVGPGSAPHLQGG